MKAKWKPCTQIITAFIYHLQVVPLFSHTSRFSLVRMNQGTLGFAGNLKVKPVKQPEPHLDQVNEDMEIPHSNVPPQQLLQLHLSGCKGTITQDGVFPLTLLDALSAFAVPKALLLLLKTEEQSFTTDRFITAKPLNGNSSLISAHMA